MIAKFGYGLVLISSSWKERGKFVLIFQMGMINCSLVTTMEKL
jgi:hypothetical protein